MDEIMIKARELGELLQQSEIMRAYKLAEAEQQSDAESMKVLSELNVTSSKLAADMQSGAITAEEAIRQNGEAYQKAIEKDEKLRTFFEKKQAADGVVNQINQILNYYITGEVPGCSHDCSSCGGGCC